MRTGILAAGNWIVDQIKVIDNYPSEEKLANILEESDSNGGGPYNILKDLYKMKVSFPLEGLGLVGNDVRGETILKECRSMQINVDQIKMTSEAPTSYTDVMSVRSSGKRTFFHNRGANALLNERNFDFSKSNAKIFYLGYLLLLDKLDGDIIDGVNGATRVLKKAKEHDFITAIDIVSESSLRYKRVIVPALPFVDYLFINEFEIERLTGVPTLNKDKTLSYQDCLKAAKKTLKMGVKKWCVLHTPEGVWAVSMKESIFQPSVKIPDIYIRGTVGAGDALAAGVLTGVHQELGIRESLKLGVGVAATSLNSITASGSVLPLKKCYKVMERYGFR